MTEPIWISTDDHTRGPFAPHGRMRIRFDRGIYFYEAAGPFNEETMAALATTRAEAMGRWPVAPGRGLVLVEWVGSAMMSPPAFRLFAEGYNRFAQGPRLLAAVAWVGLPDTEGLGLMAEHFRQLYESHGARFQLFHGCDAAIAWLQAQLDPA